MSTVIDVHTHMVSRPYIQRLKTHGGSKYAVKPVPGGREAIHLNGAPFMTLYDEMFDYEQRIKDMNRARVDMSIISLTCPNVFWGGREISAETARQINDDMASAQKTYPDRIRWFATLPWQHADDAKAELERALGLGAVGVMVLGNIAGADLTEEQFAPVWEAIDRHGLPVLLHPTAPQGLEALNMMQFALVASTGFMIDTTLALSRMIFDGFFDRYPKLKIIGGHGGATLPFIIGRLDRCFDTIPACRQKIGRRPSSYARQIYVDSVVYQQSSLALDVEVFGEDNVLYGSDYPHNIGDMIGCLSRVDSLAKSVRIKVRGGNAERIFKL
ncbi:MAG: amidohydrolase [Zoogloeaceae bacterium]|jgi:aminocarboxymuconate-semialdehyde decarboxylase|nr:amidohydrolase [Zoogloeaceae bacterium]